MNANFLLAQIGRPFLSEEEFSENGPLDFIRDRRGDFRELDGDDGDDDDDNDEPKQNDKAEIVELLRENRRLRIELEAMKKKG
jgi:hypothetical protein